MNKDEYVIINKSKLLRKIEEMEKQRDEYSFNPNRTEDYYRYNSMIKVVKQILSQSTSLIPEIEKAFDAGQEFGTNMTLFYNTDKISRVEFESTFDKEEYISNLKLDI